MKPMRTLSGDPVHDVYLLAAYAEVRRCPVCGTRWVGGHRNRRFCSTDCRDAYHGRRKGEDDGDK